MKLRSFTLRIALPVLMVLLGVGCCVWCHFHPRQLPLDQCSDLYRQYHHADGINASYLKDFPLDDTLTVPVTILQATDSAGWVRLESDFLSYWTAELAHPSTAEAPVIKTYLCPKGKYGQPMDTSSILNNDYIIVSMHDHAVNIFHIESEDRINAILLYKIKNTFKIQKSS